MIDLPEWNEWKESLLRHGKETYRAEVLDPFLVQFRDWKEVQRTRKVEREAAGLGEEKTHKKWQKKDKKGEGKTQWWDKKKRKVS